MLLRVGVTLLQASDNGGNTMELRNKAGEIAKIADNLTLKEITEMGYTVDLCDEAYDANEHWKAEGKTEGMSEYPEE
ncbi:hypothetical protein DXJ85_06630 [Vibrio parahaemolyticus]|nr:hypothetical protein DXJ85_06630 [Vibrio parahaemolyticus]